MQKTDQEKRIQKLEVERATLDVCRRDMSAPTLRTKNIKRSDSIEKEEEEFEERIEPQHEQAQQARRIKVKDVLVD